MIMDYIGYLFPPSSCKLEGDRFIVTLEENYSRNFSDKADTVTIDVTDVLKKEMYKLFAKGMAFKTNNEKITWTLAEKSGYLTYAYVCDSASIDSNDLGLYAVLKRHDGKIVNSYKLYDAADVIRMFAASYPDKYPIPEEKRVKCEENIFCQFKLTQRYLDQCGYPVKLEQIKFDSTGRFDEESLDHFDLLANLEKDLKRVVITIMEGGIFKDQKNEHRIIEEPKSRVYVDENGETIRELLWYEPESIYSFFQDWWFIDDEPAVTYKEGFFKFPNLTPEKKIQLDQMMEAWLGYILSPKSPDIDNVVYVTDATGEKYSYEFFADKVSAMVTAEVLLLDPNTNNVLVTKDEKKGTIVLPESPLEYGKDPMVPIKQVAFQATCFITTDYVYCGEYYGDYTLTQTLPRSVAQLPQWESNRHIVYAAYVANRLRRSAIAGCEWIPIKELPKHLRSLLEVSLHERWLQDGKDDALFTLKRFNGSTEIIEEEENMYVNNDPVL